MRRDSSLNLLLFEGKHRVRKQARRWRVNLGGNGLRERGGFDLEKLDPSLGDLGVWSWAFDGNRGSLNDQSDRSLT